MRIGWLTTVSILTFAALMPSGYLTQGTAQESPPDAAETALQPVEDEGVPAESYVFVAS